MEAYHFQIIETAVLIVIFIVLKYLNDHLVNKALKKFQFHINRRRIIVKTLNFLALLIGAGVLVGIWGATAKGHPVVYFFYAGCSWYCFFCTMVYSFQHYRRTHIIFLPSS